MAGDYEFVIHDQRTSFKGPKKVTDKHSTDYRGVNKPVNITLTEDGKVTGDKTGTWKLDKSDGTGDMTITLEGWSTTAHSTGCRATRTTARSR